MTSWTVAQQAPLFLEFSRQEYLSGLPFLTPRDLPDLGIEPESLDSPALAGGFFASGPPGKPKDIVVKAISLPCRKASISAAVVGCFSEILMCVLSEFFLSPSKKVGRLHECPAAAAVAKLLQSCLTLCDPTDGSPPGSPIPGSLQAGTLEWVAISFSDARK